MDPLLASSVKETDPFVEDFVSWFIQQRIRKGDVLLLFHSPNSRRSSARSSPPTSATSLKNNPSQSVFKPLSIPSLSLPKRSRTSNRPGIATRTSPSFLSSCFAFYSTKPSKPQSFPVKSNPFSARNATPSFFTISCTAPTWIPSHPAACAFTSNAAGFDANVRSIAAFYVAIPFEKPHFWTFSCCVRFWNCSELAPFLQIDVLFHTIELFFKANTLCVRIGEDETESPFRIEDGVWTGIDFVYDSHLEIRVFEKPFIIEKACPGLKSCLFGNENTTMDVLSFQANQRQVFFSFSSSFCLLFVFIML